MSAVRFQTFPSLAFFYPALRAATKSTSSAISRKQRGWRCGRLQTKQEQRGRWYVRRGTNECVKREFYYKNCAFYLKDSFAAEIDISKCENAHKVELADITDKPTIEHANVATRLFPSL